ncbi:hypothetical protein HPB48_022599 [Haemaphysalis longicornis]|uniref:Ionotropic receptor n=1 Tax=Haemaphysalis longicornis TaxID=44386 RepID=A0A9J6H3A2_HAELO|nr:hypothetical protein HPB48_022599 [Haemaphysalis longicornis]
MQFLFFAIIGNELCQYSVTCTLPEADNHLSALSSQLELALADLQAQAPHGILSTYIACYENYSPKITIHAIAEVNRSYEVVKCSHLQRLSDLIGKERIYTNIPAALLVGWPLPEVFVKWFGRYSASYLLFTILVPAPEGVIDQVCSRLRDMHRHSVALTHHSVIPCSPRQYFPKSQHWSVLKQNTVRVSCGRPWEQFICQEADVRVVLDALEGANASVVKIYAQSADTSAYFRSRDFDIDFSIRLATVHVLRGAFIPVPLRYSDISFYVKDERRATEKTDFLEWFGRNLKTAAIILTIEFTAVSITVLVSKCVLREPVNDVILLMAACTVAHGTDVSSRSIRSSTRRFLFAVWALGCLVTLVYFQCILTSSFSASIEPKGLDTVDALSKAFSGNHYCPCFEIEIFPSLLLVNEDIKKYFMDLIFGKKGNKRCSETYFRPVCMSGVRKGTHAALVRTLSQCALKREFGDNIVRGTEALGHVIESPVARRDFELRYAYNTLLRRVHETGWILRAEAIEQVRCRKPVELVDISISWELFAAVFGYGVLASMLTLGLEVGFSCLVGPVNKEGVSKTDVITIFSRGNDVVSM